MRLLAAQRVMTSVTARTKAKTPTASALKSPVAAKRTHSATEFYAAGQRVEVARGGQQSHRLASSTTRCAIRSHSGARRA